MFIHETVCANVTNIFSSTILQGLGMFASSGLYNFIPNLGLYNHFYMS